MSFSLPTTDVSSKLYDSYLSTTVSTTRMPSILSSDSSIYTNYMSLTVSIVSLSTRLHCNTICHKHMSTTLYATILPIFLPTN